MFDGIRLPQVVGFAGYAGCGKDTAADVLNMFGYQRLAFADCLRDVVHEMFDIPYEWMLDRKLKETPMDIPPYKSPREILQYVGTEAMRAFYPEIWVSKVKRTIKANPGTKYVITDLRFPNEIEMFFELRDEGISTVTARINRAGVEQKFAHSSESYITNLKVDEVLKNEARNAYLFQKEVLNWAVGWGHEQDQ